MVLVKQQKAMKHKPLENSKCHLPELLPELVMILARRQDMPRQGSRFFGGVQDTFVLFAATRIGGSPDHDLGDAEVVWCLLDISELAFIYFICICILYAFYMPSFHSFYSFHSVDSFHSFHSFRCNIEPCM